MEIIQSKEKDGRSENKLPLKPDQRKESYYFSHDANARNDFKLLKVRRDHGPAGYGIYFMIIEVLRDQQDFKLPLSSIPDLAYEFHFDKDVLCAIVKNYELFEIENEMFFSARLCRTMDYYNEKKIKYQEAGRKGGKASLKHRLSSDQAIKGKGKGNEREIKLSKKKGNNLSEFECFWNLYDKKRGKDQAIRQWQKLTENERSLASAYVSKYLKAQPDKKYRKDPANFLRNKCFNDEIIESAGRKPPLAIVKSSEQAVSSYVQAAYQS